MNVKIDTKEKFTVLTLIEENISAKMTADIAEITKYASKEQPHLVINMRHVAKIDPEPAAALAELQQQFYERDQSFVVCELTDAAEAIFDEANLTEMMNITPTESEAWDIVQMEEIERALLGDVE